MGWLSKLLRRGRRQGTEPPAVTAAARREDEAAGRRQRADELEEIAHAERDNVVLREPRLPPGTG